MHYLKLTSYLVSILILSTHCAMPSRAAPDPVTFKIETNSNITSISPLEKYELSYYSDNDRCDINSDDRPLTRLAFLAAYDKHAVFFQTNTKNFSELHAEESVDKEAEYCNSKGVQKEKKSTLSGKEISTLITRLGSRLPEKVTEQNQWPALKTEPIKLTLNEKKHNLRQWPHYVHNLPLPFIINRPHPPRIIKIPLTSKNTIHRALFQ